MTDLQSTLHVWIDAEASRMHQMLDELLERHRLGTPALAPARICIDAGHGGEDPGAVAGDLRECDLVLPYAIELAYLLRARGHQVLLTRTTDALVSLAGRAQASNGFAAEAFISIHANASADPAARGAWILHAAGSVLGWRLADRIFTELERIPGLTDGSGGRKALPDESPWVAGRRLAVLRRTYAPAVLLELGFLTNPSDAERLARPQTQSEICRAICEGTELWLANRSP